MKFVDLDHNPSYRTFPARYSGRCGNCDEYWEEGDDIGYWDEVLCCEWCLESLSDTS